MNILRQLLGWVSCKFCDRWVRGYERDMLVHFNGVCSPCRRETISWLNSMGCVVTWPRELVRS